MTERQSWAEERLVSYLLDTLPADQAAEVEQILGQMSEYQEILEGRGPEEVGHLPPALLARWQKLGLHIVGVERVLVLQHLESCPTCREELELVGGSVQSWAEAPESQPHEPMGSRPSRLGPPARARRSPPWTAWVGGAALGIAAGILLMLYLPRDEAPSEGLHGAALPVIVPQNLRGGDGEEIQFADAHAPVLLALVIPSLAEDRGAELVVRDPAGLLLSRTPLRMGPDADRTAQIVLQPQTGWQAGKHAIELMVAGETEIRELGSFTVSLAP